MKIALSLATAAMIVANGAGAMAGELPAYQVSGFPISPVQVGVLGAAHVEQQSPAPQQAGVLAPHRKRTAAASAPTTIGTATR